MTSKQRRLLSEKFYWKSPKELNEMVQKVVELLALDEWDAIEFLRLAPVRKSQERGKA